MKQSSVTRGTALALAAAVLLGTGASAFFQRQKTADEPEEGAPAVRDLEITTYREIPCESRFQASDSEGDDLTFSILREPKKGSVVIDGVNFTYTPDQGKTGGDSFTYTAADSAGHVSQPATVTVTIEKIRSGVTYADTGACKAAAAAQHLAEEGVFTGVRVGEQYYFEPERQVSRGEFLAMVLEACGRETTEVTMTGFCDDASIPVWAKPYAAAGVADGIVQGKATADGAAFRAEDPVTFNEAATVLDRVLDLNDVDLEVWYGDRTAAPSWAAQAVGNMEAVQVLAAGSFGSADLCRQVSRADAADMLSAVMTLLEREDSGNGSGLFS